MSDIEGVLLDVDGVLVHSWQAIPGAVDATDWMRGEGIPFRCVTNTTQLGRAGLTAMLREAGFDVVPEEVITASVATGAYLRKHHPGARCFLLAGDDAKPDLAGVEFTDGEAEVVVMGDAEEAFSYENMNKAFRMLMNGAKLVAMHKNLYWNTDEGLTLDVGAFVAGLEAASGAEAVVVGKPSPDFFLSALESIGQPPGKVAMVGDDIVSDVLAAEAAGMTGVLVKTGKFRPKDLEREMRPRHVIDSIADLPKLLA
ncbi:MAG: TIGR01458 family HAD-type hydrolase [Actinomycetota bacterium]